MRFHLLVELKLVPAIERRENKKKSQKYGSKEN